MTIEREAEAIARALADPAAIRLLRSRLRDESAVDLARVHPTWLARALREESPAVRATVAARGPAGLGRLIRADGALPEPDRPPNPEVLGWVLALWTERLAGGSDREDDPPVIVALTRLSAFESYRLWRNAGLIKLSLAGEGGADWAEEHLGKPSPEAVAWAARDLVAVRASGVAGRRGVALLGLVTALRLLAVADPFAARRALQRIPYPVVRQARAIAPASRRPAPGVLRLEEGILRAARDRLGNRGRISIPHPSESRP